MRIAFAAEAIQKLLMTPPSGQPFSESTSILLNDQSMDEYLMHTYIRLKKGDPLRGDWKHMDLIIKETTPGSPQLKWFYIFEPRAEFPPGVVC